MEPGGLVAAHLTQRPLGLPARCHRHHLGAGRGRNGRHGAARELRRIQRGGQVAPTEGRSGRVMKRHVNDA